MSHYYENNPDLRSKPLAFTFTFRGVKLALVSDAGVFSKARVDFGSALLLKSLPDDLDGKKILDIGCGYGAIGLSVAKAYPNANVEMTDVNLRALDLAEKNALSNGIKNAKIYESNLYENVSSSFDLIISNPPIRAGKEVVHGIAEKGYEHLNAGGELWMVIQKKQGAPSLLKKLESLFPEVETVSRDKGYYVFCSRKL